MSEAVVFGCGSTVDMLDQSFFDWVGDRLTFSVNRSPFCRRFAEVGFVPKYFCAWDPYKDAYAGIRERLLKAPWNRVKRFLADGWNIPREEPRITPINFTLEWATLLAGYHFKCERIYIVGGEGMGPYCRLDDDPCPRDDMWINGHDEADLDSIHKVYRTCFKFCKDILKSELIVVGPMSVLYPDPICIKIWPYRWRRGKGKDPTQSYELGPDGAVPSPATMSRLDDACFQPASVAAETVSAEM